MSMPPSATTSAGSTAIFPLAPLLPNGTRRVSVVDVGALSLGDDGDAYSPLLNQNLCDVVGFEPAPGECEKLNDAAAQRPPGTGRLRFLPTFVGDGKPGVFRLNSAPMTSSLFEPNTALLERFNGIAELCRVVSREDVTTATLDSLRDDIGPVDWIKIDVQGGELAVIEGATELLKTVAIVEVEVEFVPLYADQPLFADIDKAMRDRGFVFHRFSSQQGRCMKPLSIAGNPYGMLSQMLWGDAIYVRDLFELRNYSQPQLLSAALVLHEVYHSYDVVAHILQVYDSRAAVAPVVPHNTDASLEQPGSSAEGELNAVRAEIEQLKTQLQAQDLPAGVSARGGAAPRATDPGAAPTPLLHKQYMQALGVPPG